ncbi:MAG: hypothetical protein ACO3K7_04400 [Candidatus Marinamargulisbacteria bacterium]
MNIMILGINAVQNPIDYGVYSESHSIKYAWDGLGNIEQLPLQLKALISKGGALNGVCTILGPGNYTGVRLALTTAKMIAMAQGIPLYGVSLFDAYAQVVPTSSLRVITSVSRKGWLNAQLFQTNTDGISPISTLHQLALNAMPDWMALFETPIIWEHLGDWPGGIDYQPRLVSLDILAVLAHFKSIILTTDLSAKWSPIYAYPAVAQKN